jgi:hypothetical protein
MAARFMEGVDPIYQRWISSYLGKTVENFASEILAEHTALDHAELAVVKRLVREKIKGIMEEFTGSAERFRSARFTNPVVNVVDRCPKEELASIAESLVSLSVLERRMAGGKETVGGPIDVAVVSKGDGFIWIKRKHYFDIDMNRHFWQTYFDSDRLAVGTMQNE